MREKSIWWKQQVASIDQQNQSEVWNVNDNTPTLTSPIWTESGYLKVPAYIK